MSATEVTRHCTECNQVLRSVDGVLPQCPSTATCPHRPARTDRRRPSSDPGDPWESFVVTGRHPQRGRARG